MMDNVIHIETKQDRDIAIISRKMMHCEYEFKHVIDINR